MKTIIFYLLALSCAVTSAQEKDLQLPKANEAFAEKDYAQAEAGYRISQSKFATKATSSYNLGNSIYRQKQFSEARNSYLKAIKNAKTRPQKHYAYHNLGNVFMEQKMYTEAVEAYKDALRNNPDDEQTRYNYALAKDYLKNNPPPKDDKKDDKKDKKDDKKDKKDEPKKDDKGEQDKKKEPEKGDDDKKDGDKPEEKPQPKPEEGGISKQRLESLLDAVNNEERKVQGKVNDKKVKGKPKRNEKDW